MIFCIFNMYLLYFTLQFHETERHFNICDSFQKPNFDFVAEVLWKKGGFYIHENTLLVNFKTQKKSLTLIHAFDIQNQSGFIMAQPQVVTSEMIKSEYFFLRKFHSCSITFTHVEGLFII